MQGEVVGEVDYIHPYGKGFMIYTDKPWSHGIMKVGGDLISIFDGEYINVRIDSILSIDKSITLPAVREGRALLLIEYLDLRTKSNIYLLVSAKESFIRNARFAILSSIVSKTKVMYRIDDKWYPGRVLATREELNLTGIRNEKIHVKDIIRAERKKMDYGLRKIGVISIDCLSEEKSKNVLIFVNPMKRMFFWQLIHQMIEDYINSEIIANLSNLEKMVIHLISKEWIYDDIMAKLELSEEELEEIVDKLVRFGIVRRIVILKLTDKGKQVNTRLGEEIRLP